MTWFLDANICIEFLRGRLPLAREVMKDTSPKAIKVPAIVSAELHVGALKSAHPEKNLNAVRDFLAPFEIVAFDAACVEAYAQLRAKLETAGEKIGPHDQLIAATVLAHDAILVTLNQREFSRVPGLHTETWAELP